MQAANGEAVDAQILGIPHSSQWGTESQLNGRGGFQTVDLDRCTSVRGAPTSLSPAGSLRLASRAAPIWELWSP
jgi:hypothetical protein